MGDRPILAPALGAVAVWAIWMGEFDGGEIALRRAWEVAEPQIDPAAAVLLHLATGQLHAARGQVALQDNPVATSPCWYVIRIRGRLGPTALSAFPSMACEIKGDETVLTGLVADGSALFGVLGQIEALGLDLLELRQIPAGQS